LARQQKGKLTIVALGANGRLADAKKFVARHKLSVARSYFDTSLKSWAAFGVTSQPYGILFSADGEVIAEYPGEIDPKEVVGDLASA
jgi:thioredoxin-related protein